MFKGVACIDIKCGKSSNGINIYSMILSLIFAALSAYSISLCRVKSSRVESAPESPHYTQFICDINVFIAYLKHNPTLIFFVNREISSEFSTL